MILNPNAVQLLLIEVSRLEHTLIESTYHTRPLDPRTSMFLGDRAFIIALKSAAQHMVNREKLRRTDQRFRPEFHDGPGVKESLRQHLNEEWNDRAWS